MPRIDVRSVSKRFDGVAALDRIELSIPDGEHLAVLGPSGSGKSTLLRIIAGLEGPDGGCVAVDDVDQSSIPAHRRDVAIVFQHFALYPHLSSLENITLGLRHGLKMRKVDAEDRAREVASRMQVEHLLARKPGQMSGGQRQRIAVARALARQSGIVLLDEPLSGLDAQLHAVLRVEITELLRSVGATSVNVTHDQTDAMAMADRVAVLNEGRVEQIGTPDELYALPSTLFVAGFIGSPPMNLIAAQGNPDAAFTSHFQVPRSAHLGMRPEDIHFDRPFSARDWSTDAWVSLIEPSGADRIVRLHVHSAGQARQSIAVRCRAGEHPGVATSVRLFCDPDRVHVYGEDGRRIGFASEFGAQSESPTVEHSR